MYRYFTSTRFRASGGAAPVYTLPAAGVARVVTAGQCVCPACKGKGRDLKSRMPHWRPCLWCGCRGVL